MTVGLMDWCLVVAMVQWMAGSKVGYLVEMKGGQWVVDWVLSWVHCLVGPLGSPKAEKKDKTMVEVMAV